MWLRPVLIVVKCGDESAWKTGLKYMKTGDCRGFAFVMVGEGFGRCELDVNTQGDGVRKRNEQRVI